ncbi:hypothetical protein PMAYCL1PPCAC_24459 [Pristionchus mayeri]|uniref:Uncharacterized protein n=1 Tax=Pristionchus mayeri TaxID=1317129 RepID=A0AAN5D274_9BILA|nr:hypothetical protein PMAYCL1PPCAC_24459 [Pristionchus mayeri]
MEGRMSSQDAQLLALPRRMIRREEGRTHQQTDSCRSSESISPPLLLSTSTLFISACTGPHLSVSDDSNELVEQTLQLHSLHHVEFLDAIAGAEKQESYPMDEIERDGRVGGSQSHQILQRRLPSTHFN